MFKLESYITPVLLNYVGKYVKNFKPEQSQVSLWGGDATFQNLDLRLNVLNEQFHFPFTFVSGHIHELSIHVPWSKITSEPIVITINTIECILKMKDGSETDEDNVSGQQRSGESLQENAPSGYMKSIVTKVVNNITINCNNLILKFVEEDIVLSVNIRFLSMQTVNNEWKPTFTDVSGLEMILRRVVTIEDLTLCLDRMDSSGKIDIYQDPVVYRCSMTIRLLMNYQNNQSKRATITRFDMHCKKMDFSMTEQQIPMLLRLIIIMMSRKTKKISVIERRNSLNVEDDEELDDTESRKSSIASMNNLGWSAWAWNAMTSALPVDWNGDWSLDQDLTDIAHTFHFGIYIEDAVLTFKTVEKTKEHFTNKNMKIKYRPFLTLRLFGLVLTAIQQNITATAYQIGLGAVQLLPRGNCSCGYLEVKSTESWNYVTSGCVDNSYLTDSLFDDNSPENKDKIRDYKDEIHYRLASHVIAKEMLKNCPAFSLDFVHLIELPENITDVELYEIGNNFEHSNFKEDKIIRYFIGDLTIRICSGIIHRLTAITKAIEKSEFMNCLPGKSEAKIDELPPVTIEEFTALSDYVPITKMNINIFKLVLQLQLADHRIDKRKFKTNEKGKLNCKNNKLPDYPKLSIEFDEISGTIVAPMYGYRLVACASKQHDLPGTMLNNCYKKIDGKVVGFNSRLYLSENLQTSIIMPSNFECNLNILLYPQYWCHENINRREENLKIDSLSITTTKAKLMISHSIIMSIFYPDTIVDNPLVCSSLFNDAINEINPVYLEFLIENVNYLSNKSLNIVTKKFNISTIKIFALNDTSQAFILSGPENNIEKYCDNVKLLTGELKLPDNFDNHDNNSIIFIFKIAETRVSIDPLFLDWLSYKNTFYEIDVSINRLESHEENSSDTSTKKTFPSLHENVHSSSEKERKWRGNSKKDESKKKIQTSNDPGIFNKIKNSHNWWKNIVLSGTIEPFVIYLPTKTMNGLEMNGIEDSKNRALIENNNLEILVIKTSHSTIMSLNFSPDNLNIENITTNKLSNFPWALNLSEFYCYTVTKKVELNFLRVESFKATVDAIIKSNITTTTSTENLKNTLGICIYIDTSPIIISTSKDQLKLINTLLQKNIKIIQENFQSSKIEKNIPTEINHRFVSQTSQSPHIFCTDETDTTSTISASKQEKQDTKNSSSTTNVSMTAWIQWTITKVAIKLYSIDNKRNLSRKTVINLEDIITSLDWQPIYIQLKSKITTAVALHYKRANNSTSWQVGEYSGLIMCLTENQVLPRYEDFFNVTATIASSSKVYTKWNTDKQHRKFQKERCDYWYKEDDTDSSYITEIVIKHHEMEIILPFEIIDQYCDIISTVLTNENDEKPSVNYYNNNKNHPIVTKKKYKNDNLPLIYFDSAGIQLVFPMLIESNNLCHDTIVFGIGSIEINPHPINPICRMIYRSDIYESAGQANILNKPGSAVEDRQYNISLMNVILRTETWKVHEDLLKESFAKSSLCTINENPALEWNTMSDFNCYNQPSYIFFGLDINIIIAPPIIYKSDIIVCGSAVELTCQRDMRIDIVIDEVRLLSLLMNKLTSLTSFKGKIQEDTTVKSDAKILLNSPARIFGDNSIDLARECGQDSGVDVETASTDITFHALQSIDKNFMTHPPHEYLLNFGKISIDIYGFSNNKVDDKFMSTKCLPLMCVTINQPHAYILQKNMKNIVQINCFDFSIAFVKNMIIIDGMLKSSEIFDYYLVETKSGDSNPNTGIPPSFFVGKFEKCPKNFIVNIEMGRPMKLNCSSLLLERIETVREKIVNCFYLKSAMNDKNNEREKLEDNVNSTEKEKEEEENKTKKFMMNISDLNVKTRQLVLELKTDTSSRMMTSIAGLSVNLSIKSRTISTRVLIKSAIITTSIDKFRTLLKPLTMNIVTRVMWEPWQDANSIPQIRIQAHSDDICLDFGPEHLRVLQDLQNNINKFTISSKTSEKTKNSNEDNNSSSITEQHYQDDLKIGAFQFIQGNADDLPHPYQVIFSLDINQTIAWRYPQPRLLTRLHVTPGFFDIIDESKNPYENIHCVIEFWSDSLMSYQRYIELNLSNTETSTFQLRNKSPTRAVACVWRLVLYSADKIDTQTLAGCLRIDSYFNSSLIPNVEITLSFKSIELALYNHLDTTIYKNLPKPFDNFKLNSLPPSSQCFSIIKMKNIVVVYNKWSDSMLVDVTGSLNIQVLDHGHLRMKNLLEKLDGKLQISVSDQINIVMMSNDVWIVFGPEISHTLTSAFNIWSSTLGWQDKCVVILTRFIVANDSNIPIIFSQNQSPDNILLQSRECYFYSWCQTDNKTLRICVNKEKDIITPSTSQKLAANNIIEKIWSREFNVKNDGTQRIKFNEKSINFSINVSVKSLSATQKLIKFSGQLIIFNKLENDIQLKLIKYQPGESKENKKIVNETIFFIKRQSKPASIVIEKNSNNFSMRLIFMDSMGSQWTGDIPLHPNKKCDQPWLVKVPIQSPNKFLSIWVRIIRENNDLGRILVIFSPLYMVKSFLPKNITIQVSTPTLSSSFTADIEGLGKSQQLNCPGTFENFHQLTINNEESKISTFQNNIPLSYGLIDQRVFFKQQEKDNVDNIIEDFELMDKKVTWPFQDDGLNIWKAVEDTDTHVLIKYRDAGIAASTLLLEIRPWCFISNSTGQLISILSDNNKVCKIPHHHVASPPKLDGIFHIEIEIDGLNYKSSPLQLANSEWNRGFIMPQISGLIPVEGTIKIMIDCGTSFCYLLLTSSIQEEMRIIKISSSHIVCNFTDNIFNISTISAGKSSSKINLPDDLSICSEKLDANQTKSKGKPITKWFSLDKNNPQSHELLFITLSIGDNNWSCPVKVDQTISRACIAVPNDTSTIPIVVTTQKDRDITFIVISKDIHPQLLIKNSCPFELKIGTPNSTSDDIEPDVSPFTWVCRVPSKKSCHYTTFNYGSRIPDASIAKEPKTILFLTSNYKNWYKIIEIAAEKPVYFDQYIQIDSGSDLKINVQSHGHSVTIIIEPKSKIEISAKHIRARLTSESVLDNHQDQKIGESSICECPTISNEEIKQLQINSPMEFEKKSTELDKLFTFYFHGITVVITEDNVKNGQKQEVASLYLVKTVISLTSIDRFLNIALMTADLQLDNQMFDKGGFDFPVVLISQKPSTKSSPPLFASKPFPHSLENIMNELKKNSLITFECFWEKIDGKNACKSVHVRFLPINIYIEDKYVTQLLEYATSIVRPCLVMPALEEEDDDDDDKKNQLLENFAEDNSLMTLIPENIIIDAMIMSSPLQLQSLTIEPISILLSVHTSVRLYVALDHSPLHFGIFERHNLFTTPYKLGNALTMHYLSGAIFGAGWVVGSLEILGSPGSFAQALGSGLKDFIALPFQGLLQGPWGFIVGITHGSASLMKNITAGTVNSLTKLASSVARNLDRLTLDEEHLQRQEESRRIRPQGMTQGLYQGLTGFGISLLAAVAGIAHHPLQNFFSGDGSTTGLVTGVGVGLVGVVTKPLSGAAELVALTGQGLLYRTGWNSLPAPRRQPDFSRINELENSFYSTRFYWKLEGILYKKSDKILHICFGKFDDNKGSQFNVTIVLTRRDLIVINIEEDKIYKTFVIRELNIEDQVDCDSLFKLNYLMEVKQRDRPRPPSERYEMTIETRNRIEQYVINSTGLANLTGDSNDVQGNSLQGTLDDSTKKFLIFYLEPCEKKRLIDLMKIIKKQARGTNFTVL